jgi:ribosomal protein L24
LRVYPSEERVLVAGVNVVKRHQRQTARVQGGIVSKEAPLHLSKIAYVDPKTGGPTRIGFKILGEGAACALPRSRERFSMSEAGSPKTGQAAQGGEAQAAALAGRQRRRKKKEAQAKGAAPAAKPRAIPITCRASRSTISTWCVRS